MTRRARELLGVAAMLVAMLAAPSVAVACVGGPLLESGMTYEERADVIFTGTAVRVEAPWPGLGSVMSTADQMRWTFAVDDVDKGDVASRFTIVSARGGASCGFGFGLGERYRVIAWDDGYGLQVTQANGTKMMAPLLRRRRWRGASRQAHPSDWPWWVVWDFLGPSVRSFDTADGGHLENRQSPAPLD